MTTMCRLSTPWPPPRRYVQCWGRRAVSTSVSVSVSGSGGGSEGVCVCVGVGVDVVFATTNEGKLTRAREHVARAGSRVDIVAWNNAVYGGRGMDHLVETQRESVREVALDKARAARRALTPRLGRGGVSPREDASSVNSVKARPHVLAHDCGIVVRALGGFPGAYTKDFNFKVGGSGLLRLLAPLVDEGDVGVVDRAASWDETIVFIDGNTDEEVIFTRESTYDGEISRYMPKKWIRWRDAPERSVGAVFVPTAFGFHEPLADVSEVDYQRFRRDAPSVWNAFAEYCASREW